jgi:hypothetical protein
MAVIHIFCYYYEFCVLICHVSVLVTAMCSATFVVSSLSSLKRKITPVINKAYELRFGYKIGDGKNYATSYLFSVCCESVPGLMENDVKQFAVAPGLEGSQRPCL